RNAFYQCLCGEKNSGCAISALSSSQLGKRLLQGMELRSLGHTFDGGDFMSFQCNAESQAGKHGLAIDQHGATSTLAQLATMLGTGELQVLAKDFEKRFVRGEGYFDVFAINTHPDVRFLE